MKKALIIPNVAYGSGCRIAEVTDTAFPVAEPLFWVDVSPGVTVEGHCYVPNVGIQQVAQEEPEKPQTPTIEEWREATEVSRFQARVALYNFGLFETVDTYMKSSTAPFIAKEAWESASVFKRNSPTIISMGTLLKLTDEQLDELFKAALEVVA